MSKHEIVRAELGVEFDGDQLLACQNVLVQSILNILEERQQSQAGQQQAEEASAEAQAQPEAPAQAEPEAPYKLQRLR